MNRAAMALPRRSSALIALCAFALTACGGGAPPPLAGAALGGDFTLTDPRGHTVHYHDFAGKYRVLYFGYTFCPDVCPLDLQHLMQGYHAFARVHPALAGQVQPLFITIDPARDTPQKIGAYAAAFGPELLGLTGSDAEIAAAAKAWSVYYARRDGATRGAYLMDHSRAAYLMGRDGQPIALLPADKDGPAVAVELEKWVK